MEKIDTKLEEIPRTWVSLTTSFREDLDKWDKFYKKLFREKEIDIKDGCGGAIGSFYNEAFTIPIKDLNQVKGLLSKLDVKGKVSVRCEENRNNDKYTSFVNKINSLIEESFGPKYRGNYSVSTFSAGSDGSLDKKNSLEFIARPFFLIDPSGGAGVAGLIGNGGENPSDGSVIAVRKDKKKYVEAAEKYAKLYKENFGKDVDIIYVKKFSDLIEGRGVLGGGLFPKDFGFKSGGKISIESEEKKDYGVSTYNGVTDKQMRFLCCIL